MSAVRNAGVLPSRRALLVGSVGLDVLWRLPEDVLAPLVSLVGGFLGSPAVATLTSWVMFAVALYSLAHLAYPQERLPRDTTGFRLGFAAGTLPVAYALEGGWDVVSVTVVGFATLLGAGGLQLAYLRLYHGWRVLDPEGPTAGLIAFVFPGDDPESVREELRDDLAHEGALGVLGAGLYVLAVTMMLSFPCVAAGIAVVILFDTFPVPDLLFLAWGVAGIVAPRLNRGPSQSWIDDRSVDFEESLLDSVENVTRSIAGLVLGLYTLLGIFGFGLLLYYAIDLVPTALGAVRALVDAATSTLRDPVETVLDSWNVAGVAVTLLFSGAFGLWAWMRAFRRLPHYLDHREERDLATGRVIARPPGLVAVPLVGLLLVKWYLYRAPAASLVFAIAWPVTIGVGLAVAHRTRTMAPQPIGRDDVVVVAGLIAETVVIWTLDVEAPLATVLLEDPARLQAPALVCGLFVFLWAMPKLRRASDRGGQIVRLLPALAVVGLGVVVALGRSAFPPGQRAVLTALSVFCLAAGALWAEISRRGL